MINNCMVLLFCVLAVLPAFSAQHVALHPRPGFDPGDQETIRQIVDMERQAKEASLRRDADFSLRTLAEDYVAITPLGMSPPNKKLFPLAAAASFATNP